MQRMTNLAGDPRSMFDRAVEHTRALSEATFDQWFGGVQFDDLTDGVLTLRVQNEFVLEWVRANFVPALTEKIRELSGSSVQVAWTVDQNLESPVSSRPQLPPIRPRTLATRPSTPPLDSQVEPIALSSAGSHRLTKSIPSIHLPVLSWARQIS